MPTRLTRTVGVGAVLCGAVLCSSTSIHGCVLPAVGLSEGDANTLNDEAGAPDKIIDRNGGEEPMPSMSAAAMAGSAGATGASPALISASGGSGQGGSLASNTAGVAGSTIGSQSTPEQPHAGSAGVAQPAATAGTGARPPEVISAPAFANWPMPSLLMGSRAKPSYAVDETTVTDNVTHLVWQRNVPLVTELCAGQFNDRPGTALGACGWEEARQYCASASVASALGQTGWRLPSKIELESIIDETRVEPAIDVAAFPQYPATEPNIPASLFWADTPYAGNAGWAWTVDLTTGESHPNEGFRRYRVRCVR